MPVSPGSKLGPYEILAWGEVAIKVLPAERMALAIESIDGRTLFFNRGDLSVTGEAPLFALPRGGAPNRSSWTACGSSTSAMVASTIFR